MLTSPFAGLKPRPSAESSYSNTLHDTDHDLMDPSLISSASSTPRPVSVSSAPKVTKVKAAPPTWLDEQWFKFKYGALMGFMAGGMMGFLYGSLAVFSQQPRPPYWRTVAKTMLTSGASFAVFLGFGSLIRSEALTASHQRQV